MTIEPADHDEPPALTGQTLASRYLVEHFLGEGAMGAVYKARHVKVGRPFAVKVLHKRLIADPKVLQRFEREAELAGRLRHPNVIGVVDVGETPDGYRYMVMDFASGSDLATLMSEAPMPRERIIHLVRQLLEGLYHAHEQGLIHRDFKPENVIVERDDHDTEVPRIVDFGIAILREGGESSDASGRLTTNGLVLGTPHYMAPEQAIADPIDHRIDLFALGIVIYEMLCGKLPFDGTGVEVARANLLLDPPPIVERVPMLEVDPLLEAFARRLMAKKRDRRPPTAKAARELLDLIVDDPRAAALELGVSLSPPERTPATTQPSEPLAEADAVVPAPNRFALTTDVAPPLDFDPKPRRRNWSIGALGAAVVVIAVVLVVIATRGSGTSDDVSPRRASVTSSQTAPEPTPPVAKLPDDPPRAPAQPAIVSAPSSPRDDRATPDASPERAKPAPVKPGPRKPASTSPRKPPSAPPDRPVEPAVTPIDTKLLYTLYARVGHHLAAVSAARGQDSVDSIAQRYRKVRLQETQGSEAGRRAAATLLRSLDAELSELERRK